MGWDIITNKRIIGVVLLLIIIAGGCYFWYQHQLAPYEKRAAETAEFVRQWEKYQQAKPKTATTEQAAKKATADSDTPTAEKPIIDDVVTTVQTSSNPMFAGGVPKHLQCPEEWIGKFFLIVAKNWCEILRIGWIPEENMPLSKRFLVHAPSSLHQREISL